MTRSVIPATRKKERKSTDRGLSTPFIYKFRTQTSPYLFDVNSGQILRVDEVVWRIMEDSYEEVETVIRKHSDKFRPAEIRRAYAEIQRA